MNGLRLGCWNVTWNRKDQEIINEINAHNIDLCALSETKKKEKGNIRDYILFYNGVEKNARAMAGVGILIH